jgi:hypothetical protein
MRRAVDNNGPAAREKTLLVPGSERRLCAARKIFTIARLAAVPAPENEPLPDSWDRQECSTL